MDKIEITAKRNGVEVPLSEISMETIGNMRKEKEPEPPELNHGDYGIDDCDSVIDSHKRIIIDNESYQKDTSPERRHYVRDNCHHNFTRYGNIFDDLEQYAKDIDNARVSCEHRGDYAKVTAEDKYVFVGHGALCPDCAIKYAHAIIQAACTVKRKAK